MYLESPVFVAPVDVLPLAIELPGSQSTSRIYSVVLGDLTLTKSGEEEILIAAQSSIGTYEPNIEGGAMSFVYPEEPLVAFALGSVHITGESPNNPPVAIADDTNPLQGNDPLTVHLDPTGSYDPDPGDYIALYEWDIDADGTYEYSNTDGAVVDHEFTGLGTYYVQLRVTDSFGAWDLLDVPLEIHVTGDEWPAGFYNAQNTSYNPNSHVTQPLSLVYNVSYTGNNHTMLTIGRDKIYMIESGGYLRVFDEATGTQQWEKDIHVTGISSFWTGASANLWGDSVFTGGTGIWSFDADVGTDEWHVYPSTTFDHQGMVIADDKIWFRGSGGTFVSVNTSDGSENWSIYQTSHPLFPPVYGEIAGQGYVAAPHSSYLRCLNADTGALAWQQNVGGNLYHNPVVIGEYVYYGGGSATLYKTHLSTGTNAATYNLGGYQPLGIWISETDMFVVTRLGSSLFKLQSFDFDLNQNWEVPIVNSCEQGTYSGGYIWLAVRHDGSYMQMTAYDPVDGTQVYVHPELFSFAWGGITNVNNRLYIADNQGHMLCFESE